MKKRISLICLTLELIIFFAVIFVNAATTYPQPTELKYINDYNSTIDASTKEYIISVGKELEDKTGAQAVVVVINSLQGQDINNYANELFRKWGIGQTGKNNGVLVLLSIKDRKWRVEVGTGLEGALTDIYTARVMDNVAMPKFKVGNYSQGIKDVYSLFVDSIAKEYEVTLDKNQVIQLPDKDNVTNNKNTGIVGAALLLVIIILDFIFNRGRITLFILALAFSSGRHGGGGWGGKNNGNGGGGFGGMGGGSSSGGGSSGGW
ncbi:MAG: TPM domain-containing protein [Clostridiaceae bacterium]|nr:TPM domain-containing protein [Clostridiaceae bacterium]